MLTLPNILTLSRIFAMPVLVALLWHPKPADFAIAVVLYALVAITDYFDGYLARAQVRSPSWASSSIPLPTRSCWRR